MADIKTNRLVVLDDGERANTIWEQILLNIPRKLAPTLDMYAFDQTWNNWPRGASDRIAQDTHSELFWKRKMLRGR